MDNSRVGGKDFFLLSARRCSGVIRSLSSTIGQPTIWSIKIISLLEPR